VKEAPIGRFYATLSPEAIRVGFALLLSILIVISGYPAIEAAGAAGGVDERVTVADPLASGIDSAEGSTEGASETAVSVTRADKELRYELTVSPDADVDRLWVVVGGATVTDSNGFERVENDGRTRLVWTGAEPARVVLSVQASRPGAADGPTNGRESVATERWTFASVPFVEVQRVSDGTVERSWPLTERAGGLADVHGVFGDRYALAGPTEVVTRSNTGRQVRVVLPAGATTGAAPTAIADTLADAAGRLNVGDRDESVLAYAVPGVRRGGESVPARDEFWVEADSRLDDPENVWLHEYVHTRQSFRLATDMRWFREASAEYYAARLSYEQGSVSEQALRRHLDGDPSRATLTDPTTWQNDGVPHHKGARTLAVLDSKIRAETGDHRSLEDVFRRLNRHDGSVTYAVFTRTVGEVAGTSMDGWLDKHVAGDAPVTDQYPHDSGALASGALPHDWSNSVEARSPALTFLLVSLALSVAAAAPLYRVLRRLERRQRDRERDDDRTTRRSRRPQ